MKTRFNWSTDQEAVQMLAEMASADDRKPSSYLTKLVKREYAMYQHQQKIRSFELQPPIN